MVGTYNVVFVFTLDDMRVPVGEVVIGVDTGVAVSLSMAAAAAAR